MSVPSSPSQPQYIALPRSTSRRLPVAKRVNSRTVVTVASGRVEVEEPRHGIEVLLQHQHPLVLQDVADLALRVEQVAELAGSHRAHLDAGRVAPRAGALDAEGA